MFCRFRFSVLFLPFLCLAGCYDPVENLKPTSFKETDLNQSAQGRIIDILAIMPARAEVDNVYNHARAVNAASLTIGSLFSLTGAGLGMDGMALGWYLGASVGHSLGSAIAPPALYPKSLILSYKDPLDPVIHQTIEIARPCEFRLGRAYAVLVNNHKKLETKIQPNNFNACLEKAEALRKAQKEGEASYPAAQGDFSAEMSFNQEAFLPPVGAETILKLSNPAYHSPYQNPPKISQPVKKQTGLTAKQRRFLNHHKILSPEKIPTSLTVPPASIPETVTTGRRQWQRLNHFGEGV